MGKWGLHSGYGKFQNIQCGNVDITLDGSGDGTTSVTFPHPMKTTPTVVMTVQESDTTGTCSATSVSTSGFTAKIDGSSITGDDATIGWVAMDYSA